MLFNYHIHYMNFFQQKFILWIKSSYNAYICYMNQYSYNEYDQVFLEVHITHSIRYIKFI